MDKQKQKQIEEMAKDMGTTFQISGTTKFATIDEMLMKYGYHKISENAVVLTREEYELFDSVKKGFPNDTSWLAEKYSEIGQTARNRTAKLFAERLKERLKVYLNEDLDFLMKWCECNITIDEICKEITEGKNGKT
jgi:hypothetical protein